MEKRVIGYFDDNMQVEQAAKELKDKGFKEISILGNDSSGDNKGRSRGINDGMTQNLSNGTMTGGAIGGLAGLALGAGALFIPGIGPLVAVGPLAAALGGAATGGVAGALVDYGIPKERSDFYETKIKEGNTVMILKTEEDKTDTVATIFRNHGAKDVRVH